MRDKSLEIHGEPSLIVSVVDMEEEGRSHLSFFLFSTCLRGAPHFETVSSAPLAQKVPVDA